ncbi:MAG TPA: 30S ribosomal protein S16 [Streptosporangiaceae bacterium]
MAVKIKLKRLGRTRVPTYRIVVADARTKRDGRAIEEIGKYHPKEEPSLIEVNSERAQHWLSVGAQPTPPVMNILKITGDWQKFKGEPGAEGTLRTREPAVDKKEVFAEALRAAGKDSSSDSGATTPKGGGRTRKADPKAKADPAEPKAATEPKAGAESKAATGAKAATEPKADASPAATEPQPDASSEASPAGNADASPEAKGDSLAGQPEAGSADEAAGAVASSEAPAADAKAAAQDSEPGSEA